MSPQEELLVVLERLLARRDTTLTGPNQIAVFGAGSAAMVTRIEWLIGSIRAGQVERSGVPRDLRELVYLVAHAPPRPDWFRPDAPESDLATSWPVAWARGTLQLIVELERDLDRPVEDDPGEDQPGGGS